MAGNKHALNYATELADDMQCILLCYSIISENSFKIAKDWFDAIKDEQTTAQVPIILIGTKSDLE